MEKLDLNVKLKDAKDVEKVAKEEFLRFFVNLWSEEFEESHKDSKVTKKEKTEMLKYHIEEESKKIIIDTSYVDPRIKFLDAYCVLSQKALDMLTNMGEDYLEVNKEVTTVKGLARHKKITGEIYHISLKEDSFNYNGGVTIHVVLNTTPGAYDFIKLAFLEDEMYYTRECLDTYDVKF